MADGQLQAAPGRLAEDPLRLGCIDGEGLLEIDVASGLEALPGDRGVGLRRRRHVHDVGVLAPQHLPNVIEACHPAESLVHLLGHERFAVADGDEASARHAADLLGVLVRDLPAPDNRDSQHDVCRRARRYSKYLARPSAVGTRGVQPSRSFSFRFE